MHKDGKENTAKEGLLRGFLYKSVTAPCEASDTSLMYLYSAPYSRMTKRVNFPEQIGTTRQRSAESFRQRKGAGKRPSDAPT